MNKEKYVAPLMEIVQTEDDIILYVSNFGNDDQAGILGVETI